jgi:hypothetical protein
MITIGQEFILESRTSLCFIVTTSNSDQNPFLWEVMLPATWLVGGYYDPFWGNPAFNQSL